MFRNLVISPSLYWIILCCTNSSMSTVFLFLVIFLRFTLSFLCKRRFILDMASITEICPGVNDRTLCSASNENFRTHSPCLSVRRIPSSCTQLVCVFGTRMFTISPAVDPSATSTAVTTQIPLGHELILQPFRHFTCVIALSLTLPSLYLRHSSFSNPSVASPTSQLILQPFLRFSYITGPSLTSPGEPPMEARLYKSRLIINQVQKMK